MAGRGFAGLSADARHAMAQRGGKAAHKAGTAHKWTREQAQAAGRLGGLHKHHGKGGANTATVTPAVASNTAKVNQEIADQIDADYAEHTDIRR